MALPTFKRRAAFRSLDDIVAEVEQYRPDIVSFDLFDTLVYRDLFDPADLFYGQGRELARRGLIDDAARWRPSRKRIEHALARARNPGEVKLAEIYDALLADGIFARPENKAAAEALELEMERETTHLYPHARSMLEAVKRTGAKIIVLSDTYLPADHIADLLKPVAANIDEIVCSSVTQKTKRHGDAYRWLRDKGGKALHFGDNRRVDKRNARRAGVRGQWVDWPRYSWMRGFATEAALLRADGVSSMPVAAEAPAPGTLADLGVRWSVILFDFLLDLRRHARAAGATDIWLLSRDGESLADAVTAYPGFFGDIAVQYVRASRAATHPLMARHDPARWERWHKRPPGPEVIAAAETAEAYYRGQLRPGTRHIIMVDMTSKGRLEHSLRHVLPDGVTLSGYYFSLDPGHEAAADARLYVDWRFDTFHAPVVEMLSGYSEPSCAGFDRIDGAIVPRLTHPPGGGDVAHPDYIAALRASLRKLVDMAARDEDIGKTAPPIDLRYAAIRAIILFPGAALAKAMAAWKFAVVSGGAAVSVARGGVGWVARVKAAKTSGNPWPSLAIHSALPPKLARLAQRVAYWRWHRKDRAA